MANIDAPLAVVLQGSDALHTQTTRESARVAQEALRQAGYAATTISLSRSTAADLSRAEPAFVYPCVFDDRGDDGVLQDMLELLDLPYVGSRAAAVRTCGDKIVTKHVLRQAGLPTIPSRIVARRTSIEWGTGAVLPLMPAEAGAPLVVKPVRGAAGLGIKLALNPETFPALVSGALQYDGQVMVERYVPGTELTVLVIDVDGQPRAAGAAVVQNPRLMDPTSTQWLRMYEPAPRSVGKDTEIGHLAVAAFKALGCRDYASVDLVVDNHGEPWILEVDTNLDLHHEGPAHIFALDAGLSGVQELVVRCSARVR